MAIADPTELYSVVRFIFAALFFVTLFCGIHVLRNHQRLFTPDAQAPSENSSARSYSKLQIVAVWMHALALTGAFALLLH